ncbi:MAG: hypothetical protein Q9M26_08110 [Mariprofundales bacterium]|nr:hypothetical protein [Mariprofundales bacterium]
MPTSILLVLTSFCVMGLAWFFHSRPRIHVGLMSTVMLFDLLFPVWLYFTHDWGKRLIDEGAITSFGVWTHWGLAIMLLILYGLQIGLGRGLLRGEDGRRIEHRQQAIGIVWLRLLVFASGAMLMASA